MKKYIALFAITIVAIAMMVGAQSALAAKPPPVTGIAKGQVTDTDFGAFDGPLSASGPWKLVVHGPLSANPIVNFSATCHTPKGVVKVSYIGPATTLSISKTAIKFTITSITAKRAGTSVTYWDTDVIPATPHTIIVDSVTGTMTVNVYSSPTINVTGNVNKFKGAP